LVELHRLTEPAHRALAWRASNALVSGGSSNLSEAVRAIALLPSPRGMTAAERATHVSGHTARQRLMELILNAIIVDRQELARRAERGEALTKVEALRLQLYRAEQAEAGADHPEVERLGEHAGEELARLQDLPTNPQKGEKVITPSTGDILPPSENSHLPQNMRAPVGADDWKAAPKPVIDVVPTPVEPAARAAPSPTVAGEWDRSEHGKLWREYRALHGDDYLL
jgi:hypothetical protein